MQAATQERAPSPRRRNALLAVGGWLAPHEAVLVAYFVVVLVLVMALGRGPGAAACVARVLADLAIVLAATWGLRRGLRRARFARMPLHFVSRLAVTLVLADAYAMLRQLLPLLRPGTVDARLHAMDLALFRVEPSVWLERYATVHANEWFSLAYLSYFAILLAVAVAYVAMPPSPTTHELALGTTLVFCIGHLGYVAVPATGPVDYLVDTFREPIQGRFVFHALEKLVFSTGAMKDVFPSLHTAISVWLTLFVCVRPSPLRGYGWVRVGTIVLALDIVASTLFLRWHYGVDVVAGAALGAISFVVARRTMRWDARARARAGLSPAWVT